VKILLLGANGQVGWETARQARLRGLNLIALQRHQCDITDHNTVLQRVRDISPSVVVNAAAYTAVDQAENEQALAYAVNRDAPAGIARACAAHLIPLLHISTDYVFDGGQETPYIETDPVNPLNAYGLSKWQGEEAIREYLAQHIILRTSWVYGAHGNNFVKTIIRLAKEREVLRIVDDQWGCPTPTTDIASTLLNLCERLSRSDAVSLSWGTYHYAGAPATTWFRFAEKIIRQAEQCVSLRLKQLIPITTEEYPTLAMRSKYTVLNCEKIVTGLGIGLPDWENSLNSLIHADILNGA